MQHLKVNCRLEGVPEGDPSGKISTELLNRELGYFILGEWFRTNGRRPRFTRSFSSMRGCFSSSVRLMRSIVGRVVTVLRGGRDSRRFNRSLKCSFQVVIFSLTPSACSTSASNCRSPQAAEHPKLLEYPTSLVVSQLSEPRYIYLHSFVGAVRGRSSVGGSNFSFSLRLHH